MSLTGPQPVACILLLSMSAYRFCRTDDIGLLVDALNRCWAPHFPEDPLTTPESFKRWIRDLQVWCSSCMVAFAGSDPIGVLIGAKRPSATLVHRIAVHPAHLRQGHARHMLSSLASKLAILGPPRMVAEVPATCAAARGLFEAAGYARETLLTDYVWASDRVTEPMPLEPGRFVIPVTVDDLAANGLLDDAGAAACWERSPETVTARKSEIEGLAIASDERIEAHVLYVCAAGEANRAPGTIDLIWLRSFVDDGGSRLREMLHQLRARGIERALFSKVHPAEIPGGVAQTLGLRPAGEHCRYVANARAA